jgi:hypothetical protein
MLVRFVMKFAQRTRRLGEAGRRQTAFVPAFDSEIKLKRKLFAAEVILRRFCEPCGEIRCLHSVARSAFKSCQKKDITETCHNYVFSRYFTNNGSITSIAVKLLILLYFLQLQLTISILFGFINFSTQIEPAGFSIIFFLSPLIVHILYTIWPTAKTG